MYVECADALRARLRTDLLYSSLKMITGGKIGDLMHSYKTDAEFAVFDMARCNNPDYYPWNFMENLKNGWYTSTKYNGGMRIFTPPKIIVFMNQEPPKDKLSFDRYEIYSI